MGYTFYFDVPIKSLPFLLKGTITTLQISAVASSCGLLIAIGGATARMSKNKIVYSLATAYVEVIRNTPLLVQLYFLYFGLPSLGLNFDANATAMIGLSISAGGYLTEIVRAGIEAIHKTQIEAALSLGMSNVQVFLFVKLPQAIRKVLFPIGNQFIMTVLASAIAAMISAEELTHKAMILESRTFRSLEIFTVTIFIYFALSQALYALLRLIGRLYLKRRYEFVKTLPPSL